MWMTTALLVLLVAVGLVSIGETQWAVRLVLAFVFAALAWQFWGQPLFVARMPTCDACGCPGRQFEWVAMRQFVGAGSFNRKEPGWVLASIDHLVSLPVEVPLQKGGVLRCRCRYWFRSAD